MRRAVALVNLLHGGCFREEHLPDAIVRLLQVLQKLLVHLDHLDKVTHQLRILVLRETVRRGKVLISFDTKLIIFFRNLHLTTLQRLQEVLHHPSQLGHVSPLTLEQIAEDDRPEGLDVLRWTDGL